MLDDETLRSGDLARFAAIVVGIRAYNTRAALRAAHARLMRYVEQGGTLVVQYNTNSRLGAARRARSARTRSRSAATASPTRRAAMTPLDPKHPLLRTPNRIGAADFDGWVQERGLYFAAKWDARYAAGLRAADPGETPLARRRCSSRATARAATSTPGSRSSASCPPASRAPTGCSLNLLARAEP